MLSFYFLTMNSSESFLSRLCAPYITLHVVVGVIAIQVVDEVAAVEDVVF